jgi:hypothetical protein
MLSQHTPENIIWSSLPYRIADHEHFNVSVCIGCSSFLSPLECGFNFALPRVYVQVNVIPTNVTSQKEDTDLELLLTTHTAFVTKNPQDNTIIVKPAVSSGAVGMERFFVGNADVASCRDAQRHHDELLLSGDVLVQPYVRGVEEWGVLSVVCFDRKISHAVLRKPAAQEYRYELPIHS